MSRYTNVVHSPDDGGYYVEVSNEDGELIETLPARDEEQGVQESVCSDDEFVYRHKGLAERTANNMGTRIG